MPRHLFLSLALLLGLSANAQKHTDNFIKDFIQEHRKGAENFAIKVPGWLIGLTGGVGALTAGDSDERAAFRLLSEVGTSRVLTFERGDYPNPGQTVGNFLYSLEQYHGYERWTEVRASSGETVNLSVRYEGETIRNLVVALQEEGRTVLVTSRTDLSAKELGQVLADIQ